MKERKTTETEKRKKGFAQLKVTRCPFLCCYFCYICYVSQCNSRWQLEQRRTQSFMASFIRSHFLPIMLLIGSFFTPSGWWNTRTPRHFLQPHLEHFPPRNSTALRFFSLFNLLFRFRSLSPSGGCNCLYLLLYFRFHSLRSSGFLYLL